MSKKNVSNLIMSLLPDDRPITSLQIVEYHDRCPKNFVAIHRTYDLDSDADLWRETNMFGKKTERGRYLCLSKTEGLPEYVIETVKIIGDREKQPEGYSLLSKTADTDQKAWRKRQIVYKLSKRHSIKLAVTDIIFCAKPKNPVPEGYTSAGEINGIAVSFKLTPIILREAPLVPPVPNYENDVVSKQLQGLKITKPPCPLPNENDAHDYEVILPGYHINNIKSPIRPAPRPPTTPGGTLGAYTEVAGIPFMINPDLKGIEEFDIPDISKLLKKVNAEYDFQLERQVLCTIKAQDSGIKNPFFQ